MGDVWSSATTLWESTVGGLCIGAFQFVFRTGKCRHKDLSALASLEFIRSWPNFSWTNSNRLERIYLSVGAAESGGKTAAFLFLSLGRC